MLETPKLRRTALSDQRGRLYRAGSVQITLDRYGHLLPQSCDSAGDRLEAALFVTAFAKRLQGAAPENGFRAVPPAGDDEVARQESRA
jgi:hypothetical protein